MNAQLAKQIAQLHELSFAELTEKYQELFGDRTRTLNRQFLFRRIAWRLQALAEGDLPERARHRALSLARDADLKTRPPRQFHAFTINQSKRDWRLPPIGQTLRRSYSGSVHKVKICADGFEYQGQEFASLTAVAFAITGTRWNGYSFFGLKGGGRG
jgi:hypothetical protein